MELLWPADRLTARHIRESLYPGASRGQHGTVQRLLQRLEDKGFVERDRALSVHLFSAVISRAAYASSQLESLADKLTEGAIAPFISHLIDTKRLSEKDRRAIRELLRRKSR